MHAAQTDRTHNSTATSSLPTIWDRLAAAGRTGRYYFSDIPFVALWGTKYLPISKPFADLLVDAAAGTLPKVSFVDPRFEDESSGSSSDDHPHADIRAGEQFLNQVYGAVTSSPNWARTLLIVDFDEWASSTTMSPRARPRTSARTPRCAASGCRLSSSLHARGGATWPTVPTTTPRSSGPSSGGKACACGGNERRNDELRGGEVRRRQSDGPRATPAPAAAKGPGPTRPCPGLPASAAAGSARSSSPATSSPTPGAPPPTTTTPCWHRSRRSSDSPTSATPGHPDSTGSDSTSTTAAGTNTEPSPPTLTLSRLGLISNPSAAEAPAGRRWVSVEV
jgi:hypothetical protein